MEICKSKQIQNCCQPNALLTLKEYLEDYASEETKKVGNELIKEEIPKLSNKALTGKVEELLRDIEQGGRDYRF